MKTQMLDPEAIDQHLHATSLSEQVYNVLRHQVGTGRLEPGERLRQNDLAAELRVGVSTIREALARLETEGFLVSEAYRGFRVALPTPQRQRDLGDVISALEQRAVELAADTMTPQALARMRLLLPQTVWGLEPDVPAVKRADHEFHSVIWNATDRPVLIQLLEQTWDQYHISNMTHYKASDWQRQSKITEMHHRGLLDALEAGDSRRARDWIAALWETDIQQDEEIFLRIFQPEQQEDENE
jgi:DNA-binding GntR family transcriptional regulator